MDGDRQKERERENDGREEANYKINHFFFTLFDNIKITKDYHNFYYF